jgi:hypothetical protein
MAFDNSTLLKPIATYKKFSSYSELRNHVKIPDVQRSLMPKQIHAMRLYIQESVNKGVEPVFSVIDLVKIRGDNILHIVDGQHRFYSIEAEFLENKYVVPIHSLIYEVESYEDLEEIFKLRNLGVPLPEYYSTLRGQDKSKKHLYEQIAKYLESCDKAFRYNVSSRPYININTFLDGLIKSNLYSIINTLEDFIKILNLLNSEAYNFIYGLNEKGRQRFGISYNMITTWNRSKFYLGYDLNMPYFSDKYDISRFVTLLNK